MNLLIIRDKSLTDCEDVSFETNDIIGSLMDRFKTWPQTARLYKNIVSDENEIRLDSVEAVKQLSEINQSKIYCVIYPQGLIASAAVIGGLFLGVHTLKSRSKSKQLSRPQESESPNNSLSERSNTARINERVPDIYGKRKSIPDSIGLNYKVYEQAQLIEYGYYCVGRGEYTITDVKEGETLISQISDASVEIYGPGASPYSGVADQVIGTAITEPLRTIVRYEQVQGQVLYPTVASTPSGTDPIEVGPFIVEVCDAIQMNFTFQNLENNEIAIRAELQEVDIIGTPVGPVVYDDSYATSINLGITDGGFSRQIVNPFPGERFQVTVKRFSPYRQELGTDEFGNPTAVDIIDALMFDDLYGMEDIDAISPGEDITTRMYTRTPSTLQTTEIQDRQLNCQAARKIEILNAGGTAVESVSFSDDFTDIAIAVAIDPLIGNMQISDIDVDNFRDVLDDVETEFGTDAIGKFNYTFDDQDLTFEDTIDLICESSFCKAYRIGTQLKLFFERKVDTSSLLFNHRNKVADSETRSVIFGTPEGYDGVEIEYIDDEGMQQFFFIPSNRTAVKPQKESPVGITTLFQARFHAYRIWNKLQYQKEIIEFRATQETELLRIYERIQVADNTRTKTYDGEILEKDGLTLTLSQPFEFVDGSTYIISLQDNTGVVKTRDITQGTEANQVVLSDDVDLNLTVDDEYYAQATYEIIENGSIRRRAYLVQEKSPEEEQITKIEAINYDENYYANDRDFINSVIDINGNEL